MSDDAPDATPSPRYEVPHADPQPAGWRERLTAPPSGTIDTAWFDRFYDELKVESVIQMAEDCHVARRYWEAPGWREVCLKLEEIEAALLDASEAGNHSHRAAVLLARVCRLLPARRRQV